MKSIKIIFLLVLLLAITPNALAVKRAPFPNSNPLQPIPHNVLPNITSNVNSEPTQPEQPQEEPAIPSEVATSTGGGAQNSGMGGAWIVYLVVGAAIIFGVYIRFQEKE